MRWEAEFQINGQPFTDEIRAPLTTRLQIRALCGELFVFLRNNKTIESDGKFWFFRKRQDSPCTGDTESTQLRFNLAVVNRLKHAFKVAGCLPIEVSHIGLKDGSVSPTNAGRNRVAAKRL